MASTRRVRRHETEARVLRATRDLFRTRGFAATTVRDIAAAAEVSVGTVMSVGDKHALLVASFDHSIDEIHRARADRPSSRSGNSVEQITALIEPFATLFTSEPELARKYGSVLVAGETGSNIFTELANILIGEIETVLHSAGAQRSRPLAESIYFAYIGRLFTWSPEDDRNSDLLKRELRRVVAAICETKES